MKQHSDIDFQQILSVPFFFPHKIYSNPIELLFSNKFNWLWNKIFSILVFSTSSKSHTQQKLYFSKINPDKVLQ